MQTAFITATAPAPLHSSQGAFKIAGMSLADFATAGVVLRVRSERLGETVLFASDNATIANGETRAIYRAAELARLLDSGPASLLDHHRLRNRTPRA